ncbi:PQQ-dependent dehydrogenase, methanol/ethanol family [Roseomonas sp. KE2513]|nr:PQQ-dependent dehydrogenase, methanol/ethanol family [Roseomonas sp. KE2513]
MAALLAMALPGNVGAAEVPPAEKELTPASVGQLRLAFTFRTHHPGPATQAPLADGKTLFLLTPFPHTLYALDLATPDATVRWRYTPEADGTARGRSCCGEGQGGMSLEGGRLYVNTLDGRTLALDAANGAPAWEVRTADPSSGESLASAPLPAGGKLLLGNAGDRFGVRGWIAALDAGTGRRLWRLHSTGEDAEVGIGAGFRPLYPGDDRADRGVASWPPSAWQQGGGGVSGPILWDAGSGLVFHGTGHPAPLVPDQRQGDNRWTSGLFARELETGRARWFDPLNSHDLYGLGATASSLLLDRDWRGAPRRLLVHPDANGHVYVLDRGTGEILSAEPFVPVNATAGVDLATGALRRDESKAVRRGRMTRDICPASPGAVTGASAFLPETGLLYIPSRRLCMDMEARNANYIRGTGFTGANLRLRPADGEGQGALVGWDLEAGRPAWTVPERFPLSGGVLATGGLVVYGTLDGVLKALDARSGAVLWQFQAASGILSRPVAFRGPDGHAQLAVLAGSGDGPEAEIDRRDASAEDGMGNVLRDLPRSPDPGVTLYMFRLP